MEHDHCKTCEIAVRVLADVIEKLFEERNIMSKLATDLTAVVDKALTLLAGGVSSTDAVSIAADTARLAAGVAAAGGIPTTGTLGSIGSFTGTGPTFVLSGLSANLFSPGMGPLVSADPTTGTLDVGTFTVSAVGIDGTVTVTASNGWTPVAGHQVGRNV